MILSNQKSSNNLRILYQLKVPQILRVLVLIILKLKCKKIRYKQKMSKSKKVSKVKKVSKKKSLKKVKSNYKTCKKIKFNKNKAAERRNKQR